MIENEKIQLDPQLEAQQLMGQHLVQYPATWKVFWAEQSPKFRMGKQ